MIILDYKDKRPIFEQVTDKLKRLICKGAIGYDEALPSVRSLAVELSISPNTISRAYRQLESEGYIYTVVGRGCFVSGEEEIKKLKNADYRKSLRSVFMEGKASGISEKEITELANEEIKEVYNDKA